MIAVVGSGLSGLTTVCALAHAGFDVTLVGPRPTHDDARKHHDGRTTAILAPHVTFLKKIGAWPSARHDTTPLHVMELVDGTQTVRFHSADIGLPEFGFNVSNAALLRALMARVDKTPSVTWHNATAATITKTPTGWRVGTSHNKTIDTALVIGADGRSSAVRAAAGIDTDTRAEHQSALVANFSIQKPHRNITVERYRAGGPFTLVPAVGDIMALVWCDDDAVIDDALTLDAAALGVRVASIAENRFGAMLPVTTPQKWPIRPTKARRMTAVGVALVGEAAHTLPPIGAQGFNTSIADVIALVSTLDNARSTGLALGSVGALAAYERARAADVAARYNGIVTMNDIIRATHPVLSTLRRVSLRLLATLPPVRNHIMRLGLGAARAP